MKFQSTFLGQILFALCFASSSYTQIYTFTVDTSNGDLYCPDTKKNLLKSRDDGKTWTLVDFGIEKKDYRFILHVTAYANQSVLCIVSMLENKARFLNTTNGGKNWIDIPLPDSVVRINSVTIDPITNTIVWLAGDELIWRLDLSTNLITDITPAGLSYFEKYVITPQNPDIHWTSSDVIATHILGRLFKSVDTGKNWNLVIDTASNPIREIHIDPTDPDHLFITSRTLLETHDGGTSWTDLGPPDTLVHKNLGQLAIDWQQGIMYTGTYSDSTFKSTDYGHSWESMPIPSGWTDDIILHPTQKCRVFIVLSDALYETTDCGETFTQQAFKIVPLNAEQLETPSFRIAALYPNPYQQSFGSYVSLDIESRTGQNISVSVFDILGRKVIEAGDVTVTQSEMSIPLKVVSLNPGLYAVKVSSGTGSVSKTFLVQ